MPHPLPPLALRRRAWLGLAAAAPLAAASPPELSWLVGDFPPLTVLEGPLAGQGYVDRMLVEVFWPALDDWRHRQQVVSFGRMQRELDGPTAACAVNLNSSAERRQRWLRSPPLLRFLPVGLVLHESEFAATRPFLNPRGELQLGAWLKQGDATLALMGARLHGAGIDPLVQALPSARWRRIQLDNASQVALSMVARGHGVQATFAYAFELAYLERMHPEFRGRLHWLPVQGQPESLQSFIFCSRNAGGRRALAQIEALLAQPGRRERLQSFYEAWLLPVERERLAALRLRLGEGFWREDP